MWPDGNQISTETKHYLRNFEWSPNSVLDLHSLGVHFFNPDYLPTWIDPLTYAALYHRGLTAPMALPVYNPPDTHERIRAWLEANYFDLDLGGVHYLGTEMNVQRAEEWEDKPLRICFARVSDYPTLDGAFGHYLISNFMRDYSAEVFTDFAYLPTQADLPKLIRAGLPLMFGNITKRPLTDFDAVFMATTYPGERVNVPLALSRSGMALHRWERYDPNLPYYTNPVLATAGIGSSFIENELGDNPVKGVGQNALFDYVLIGEGEVMDFRFGLQLLNIKRAGQTKTDFASTLTNEFFVGVYDPTQILFEYADKVVVRKDHTGQELDRRTYEGGGHISRISLLEPETQTRHVLVGPESEEFQDMEAINAQYRTQLGEGVDAHAFGRKYVNIRARLPAAERGLDQGTGKTPGQPVDKPRK